MQPPCARARREAAKSFGGHNACPKAIAIDHLRCYARPVRGSMGMKRREIVEREPSIAADGVAALFAERSPMPLYHRLYVILRDRIASGTHPEGSVLPSEAE